MELDDVIYLGFLILTIILGHYLPLFCKSRQSIKKFGCFIGFFIVFALSGWHILHIILCIVVNCFIILGPFKRSCHILSFAFTFTYLLFFRNTTFFYIPYPPAHTNLIQMILTLKLVGLAFEVHDSRVIKENKTKLDVSDSSMSGVFPEAVDIIQYSFFYIGILTGPYYSYKTYQDYFETNFDRFAPRYSATFDKLKGIPLYAAIFLLVSHYFPIEYAVSDEFNTERSFFYRLFYILPVFTTFRMRIYIGLILSECACTLAGLGAYPTDMNPKPGMGPSTNQNDIIKLCQDPNLARSKSYDFETIHNIKPFNTEFEPTMRNSIKSWNMCVQYWFAFVIYKRFPYKALRTLVVFAVSAFWHGIYIGYYFCLIVPPFCLLIEDVWDKLIRVNATGLKRRALDIVFWFFRTLSFSYLGIAFSLLTTQRVLAYYRSVYFAYHLFGVFGLIVGLVLTKLKSKMVKKTT